MNPEEFVYIAPDGTRYEMDHWRTRPQWLVIFDYLPILEQHPSQIAWEFLRRNPNYYRKYCEWKWLRSMCLEVCVPLDHPIYIKQIEMENDIREEFNIDPVSSLPSPDFPVTPPIFADQPFPVDEQYITTIEAFRKKSVDYLLSTRKKIYFMNPGGNWPKHKSETSKRRAHRRKQLITYLRLLDAKADNASMDMIWSNIDDYRHLSKEQAYKRIYAHWRAAKHMAMTGYRKLAASL